MSGHDPEEGIKALSAGLLYLMLAFIPQRALLASSNAWVSPPSMHWTLSVLPRMPGFPPPEFPPFASVAPFSKLTEFPQAVLKDQVLEGKGIVAKSSGTSDWWSPSGVGGGCGINGIPWLTTDKA